MAKDIANSVTNPALAVMREAKSVMFYLLKSQGSLYM